MSNVEISARRLSSGRGPRLTPHVMPNRWTEAYCRVLLHNYLVVQEARRAASGDGDEARDARKFLNTLKGRVRV